MSRRITIYCEGKRGSHDYDVLDSLLPYPDINIQPIGGVRGAKSVVQTYENAIVKSDFKILFRDRDFDKPVPLQPRLEPMRDTPNNYEYCTYRVTIENYLFNDTIFFNFINHKNLNARCNINTINDVRTRFIEAAERIKYYQAVRHALGSMRTDDTNFGTKITQRSGQLPIQLDEEYCLSQGWQKIQTAKNIADNWTEERFRETVASFLTSFDENFMNNLDFFIYFQGKDFATSLRQLLYLEFDIKAYYKYAKKNFNYTNFSDLVELNQILNTEYNKI